MQYFSSLTEIHVVAYADDTNFLIRDQNVLDLTEKTQSVYERVVTWADKNHLALNITKTKLMKFSLNNIPDDFSIFENEELHVENCSTTMMLGLTLDYKLTWTPHIETLCNKLRKNCYALRFMSKHCSKEVLLNLYYGTIHCHLRYGILNWGTGSTAERVFILQKQAIRIIAEIGWRQSCRNTFKELRILTVASIYIYELCIYIYKNRRNFTSNQHQYSTRSKNLLIPNMHRTTLYQKSFLFLGPKFFNKLDESVKNSPSLTIFKSRLKTALIQKNCYTLDEF